jgi:prepilin-type processing-associated H-X9-DG protein
MNIAVSGASILSQTTPVKTVLFGDDRIVTNLPYDSQFGTNEIGLWHTAAGGVRGGQVVFLDGHVEKR